MPAFKSKIVDINIIIDNGNATADDERLFFADNNGDTPNIFWLPAETNMLDILVQAGIFSSKGQAKKNGWKDRVEIPDGFSEFIVGKLKHMITILKASEPWGEETNLE